jgi:hypothetical protein
MSAAERRHCSAARVRGQCIFLRRPLTHTALPSEWLRALAGKLARLSARPRPLSLSVGKAACIVPSPHAHGCIPIEFLSLALIKA